MRLMVAGLVVAFAGGVAVARAQEPAVIPPPPKPSTYCDTTYGFSIAAPRFGRAAPGSRAVPVMLIGPAEQGFASNLNVLVEPTTLTLEEYGDLSVAQLATVEFALDVRRAAKLGARDVLMLEYHGRQQGRQLRWLAMIVIDQGLAYVLTCTTLPELFAKYEVAFRASLESFRLAG